MGEIGQKNIVHTKGGPIGRVDMLPASTTAPKKSGNAHMAAAAPRFFSSSIFVEYYLSSWVDKPCSNNVEKGKNIKEGEEKYLEVSLTKTKIGRERVCVRKYFASSVIDYLFFFEWMNVGSLIKKKERLQVTWEKECWPFLRWWRRNWRRFLFFENERNNYRSPSPRNFQKRNQGNFRGQRLSRPSKPSPTKTNISGMSKSGWKASTTKYNYIVVDDKMV